MLVFLMYMYYDAWFRECAVVIVLIYWLLGACCMDSPICRLKKHSL